MHNIKDIRKNYEQFAKSLQKRSLSVDINKIKDLDEKNRELIQKRENLEKEKKKIFLNQKIKIYLQGRKKSQKKLIV